MCWDNLCIYLLENTKLNEDIARRLDQEENGAGDNYIVLKDE